MVRMFLNGEAMAGGCIHQNIKDSPFLAHVQTAPRYDFYAVRDEFPGIAPAHGAGRSIAGELYEISEDVLIGSVLPGEPPELELGMIELSDGSPVFSMVLREIHRNDADVREISEFGGWRNYKQAMNISFV